MSVEIRRMRADESGTVTKLWNDAGREHPGGDDMTVDETAAIQAMLDRAAIGEQSSCLVAETEGRIVGYVHVTLRTGDAPLPGVSGEIDECYVVPEARRQGVGSALVREGVRWLRDQGANPVSLETWLDNEAARQFWASLDFEPESIRMASYLADTDTDTAVTVETR
jgi:ribosomal protein S18 acetylase RimI-like enzyme